MQSGFKDSNFAVTLQKVTEWNVSLSCEVAHQSSSSICCCSGPFAQRIVAQRVKMFAHPLVRWLCGTITVRCKSRKYIWFAHRSCNKTCLNMSSCHHCSSPAAADIVYKLSMWRISDSALKGCWFIQSILGSVKRKQQPLLKPMSCIFQRSEIERDGLLGGLTTELLGYWPQN